MKTIAVIKNELFKDYLKIVSTDNLEDTLDNPNVPMPFECLVSVDNTNSDALAEQLAGYFQKQKIRNKDFFVFNDEQLAQLSFMINLVKLSSGDSVSNELVKEKKEVEEQKQEQKQVENVQTMAINTPAIVESTVVEPAPVEPTVITPVEAAIVTPVVEPVQIVIPTDVVAPSLVVEQEEVKEQEVKEPFVQEVVSPEFDKEVVPASEANKPVFSASQLSITPPQTDDDIRRLIAEGRVAEMKVEEPMEDDPFQLAEKEVAQPSHQNKAEEIDVFSDIADEFDPFKIEEEVATTTDTIADTTTENKIESNDNVEAYHIPKNSILNFSRNDSITANLVDENNVLFEGNLLSLNDASRAAFKKAGTLGMPNGLTNWLYQGKTLKDLKDGK
jgi:hypothetical protein